MQIKFLSALFFSTIILSSCVNTQESQGKFKAGPFENLKISLASSPVSDAVTLDTDDVSFVGIKFECIDGKECNVSSVKLNGYVDDNGGVDNFQSDASLTDHGNDVGDFVTNLRLVDSSGTVYMGPKDLSSDGSVTFTDAFTVPTKSSVTLTVLGDVSDNSFMNDDGETVMFAITSGKNVSMKSSGRGSVVAGTVNVDEMVYIEIQEAVTPSLRSSPVSSTVSPGTTEVPLLGVKLECKSHSDCNITQIEFDSNLSASTTSYLSNLILIEPDSGATFAGPVNIDSRLQADFSDDFSINGESSKEFLLLGDVDASATGDIFMSFKSCQQDPGGNLEAYNDHSNIGCLSGDSVNEDMMVVITVK